MYIYIYIYIYMYVYIYIALGFAPTPTKLNEIDLRVDFNEFARKMRCKWFFRKEPTEN